MKKHLLLIAATALFCMANAVWAASSKSSVPETPAVETPDTHPVAMEGNDCMFCHDENSTSEMKSESEAGKQWNASLHGINMVPCVTCHGDESNFRAASSIDNCVSCHPGETAVINKKTEAQDGRIICVNCHAAHDFTAAKEQKPVHSKQEAT